MTIRGLVVDDDRNVRESFARALMRYANVDVRCAGTAAEAGELLELHAPHFALIDICLDGDLASREGMRVIYEAKERTPHVAAFTGLDLESELQVELARLDVTLFRKPVEAAPLLGFLRERVLRGAPLAKASPTAIRRAGEVLWRLGAPLDQNFDLAEREAIAVGLEELDGRKMRVADAAQVDRRFVDRHLTPEWEEHFRRELEKRNGRNR